MIRRNIPEPTLRRLPSYCHYLRRLQTAGIVVVSCSSMGRDLGLESSQLRKDLESTGVIGRPRIGFSVAELVTAIEDSLGWNRLKNTVLVGAGALGMAVLGLDHFDQYGLKIVGVFDADERIIGGNAHGFEVRPLGFLPGFARTMNVSVAILAATESIAQTATNLLVAGGVRAIWNLTTVPVLAPENVAVEHEDFCYPLAALSCRLARAEEARS